MGESLKIEEGEISNAGLGTLFFIFGYIIVSICIGFMFEIVYGFLIFGVFTMLTGLLNQVGKKEGE